MFYSILTLVFLILVVQGFARTIRYFWLWLGRGKDLKNAVDHNQVSQETAAETLKERPRLTRKQRAEVRRAALLARESYLDTMKLGWYQVVYVFVGGSIAGLLLEEIWMFVTAGLTQSRVGLVWGPFSPLYGTGAALLTILSFVLRRRHARAWQIFLVSVVVGGGLEQLTGWGMEVLFHAQSWTYLHLPDHITQWVAWRFLVMWGLLGLAWSEVVTPELLYRIGEPTTKRQVVFVSVLTAYLAADIFMTIACFQRRSARDAGAPAHNAFERWVDDNYTDQFMASKFQNLVVGGGASDE